MHDQTSPLSLPHDAAECPKCFVELQRDHDWWRARPAGSRLVGLVVARDGMPSVKEQRDDLTRFGVPIARSVPTTRSSARPGSSDAPIESPLPNTNVAPGASVSVALAATVRSPGTKVTPGSTRTLH